MKKILLLFMAVLTLSVTARAESFRLNGLNYEILSNGEVALTGYREDEVIQAVMNNIQNGGDDRIRLSEYVTNDLNHTYRLTVIGANALSYFNFPIGSIPNSLIEIQDGAFSNCILDFGVLPESLIRIGDGAFDTCSFGDIVKLPNTLTTIGSRAFANVGMADFTIPKSVIEIGSGAFADSTLREINVESGNANYSSIDGVLYDIDGTTLVEWPGGKPVDIPSFVTRIGDGAFMDNGNLTAVTIPNTVAEIGNSAFSGCSNLTAVTIPNSVTTISEATFEGCTSLTSVTLHNSLAKIESAAFWGCRGLTSVTFPNSLTKIGSKAFANCTGLTSVTFNNPNEDLVVYNAFPYCNFSTINFTGEYTIKSGAFNTIFEGNSSINTLSFYGNYVIGESAFENCNITYLYLFGKSEIGDKAFRNSNVANIYLTDCEGIGEYAFATSEYPYQNFYIWCFNEEPPYVASTNAFSGLPTNGTNDSSFFQHSYIYVPYNSVDSYRIGYGWERFSKYCFVGMGSLDDLTFTPSEVHLDLKKSTHISYDAVMTDGYEFTKTSWSSSDESVAVVGSSGTVQAKASGMAMIYFSYTNNYYLSSTVGATLVTVGDVDFSLTAEAEDSEIEVGETTTIVTTYGGQGYTVASETWSTSDAEVVTVDENGVVTGVADGEATITLKVTFDNGISVYRECAVSVAKGGGAGIESVDAASSAAPAEYFNLNGVRVNSNDLTPGLYIKCQGGKAEKVMVK